MSTVWTNVRIKRLLMTLLNAQDFYGGKMYHLFYNVKNTANYRDDFDFDQNIVKGIANF